MQSKRLVIRRKILSVKHRQETDIFHTRDAEMLLNTAYRMFDIFSL